MGRSGEKLCVGPKDLQVRIGTHGSSMTCISTSCSGIDDKGIEELQFIRR